MSNPSTLMYTALLRLARKWHRWFAWGLGLIVLMWFVTGIVMVYPFAEVQRSSPGSFITLDSTILAPQRALELLGAAHEGRVRSLSMREIGGHPVYLVSVGGRGHVLDARTGAPFVIADSTAASVVGGLVPGARVVEATAIRQREGGYEGALPAIRVTLEGDKRITAYMAPNGDVTFRSPMNRFRQVAGGLHSFVVPKVPMSASLRRGILIFTGVLSVILSVSGFVLLMPVRRRAAS